MVIGSPERGQSMRDFTLSQQYALIGLDGQDSLHGSVAKSAAVRAIAAAKLLEEFLPENAQGDKADVFLSDAKTVDEFAVWIGKGLPKVMKLKKKDARELEKETAESLMADGVLEKVPDLLGCDMNYDTAGVEMKAYRSDKKTYLGITERLRAEILEEGPVTAESVCLLWLLRESGCIHEIFSTQEQTVLQSRMMELCAENKTYDILWKAEFHSSLELFVKGFLRGKRNLFKNPYLEGVNLLYPFLDRRQAIFIDFVVLGTNVEQRRLVVEQFLSEKGHYVEEIKSGAETFLKIDNMYYRIWPRTITCARVPIQGAQLVPVYR